MTTVATFRYAAPSMTICWPVLTTCSHLTKTQGPYDAATMKGWFREQYFTGDTFVMNGAEEDWVTFDDRWPGGKDSFGIAD